MSGHLSARELSKWMAGEHSSASECHLSECAACRSQLEEFQAALAGFRGAVRGWSEAQHGAGEGPAWRLERPPQSSPARLYWSTMAVAFCALMALFVLHGSASRQAFSGEAHSAARNSMTNAALMRQVDTEVSQTVPDAMEPLMKLVSWDDSALAEGHRAGPSK